MYLELNSEIMMRWIIEIYLVSKFNSLVLVMYGLGVGGSPGVPLVYFCVMSSDVGGDWGRGSYL